MFVHLICINKQRLCQVKLSTGTKNIQMNAVSLLFVVVVAVVFLFVFFSMLLLGHFSIECCKTKTKVITTANQNEGKYHKEPMITRSTVKTCNWPKARENESIQATIGFSFASDLRGWREFFCTNHRA